MPQPEEPTLLIDGTPHRAVAFGEVLIDQFPDRRVVAGAPIHVAAHLTDLGWQAAVVSRVGDDDDGRLIRSTLRNHQIDTSLLEVDEHLPTGTVDIDLHDDQSHSFTIRRPVAWDAIAGPDDIPRADVLYFGTLALRDDRSRSTLERIEDGFEALRVVDINLRPPDDGDDVIRLAVSRSDVLKLSDEEVAPVASAVGIAPEPPALAAAGPTWVCVTRGGEGASLHRADGGEWHRAGLDLEVVDTVGAGDAFCAGLIDGLMRDLDPADVLERAQSRAAQIVVRRGGMPPARATDT